MGKIPKHEDLEQLADAELIRRYNVAAENTTVGTGFYRDELIRRAQQRQNGQLLMHSAQMRNMTVAITILTIANVILVLITVLK